ncbi:MAG: pseudouridine synthase [Candidatus Pacearchaeota archaeon]
MKKIYLHQFLSKTGLFESKVELIRAIRKGEIKIDDRPVINPFFQFRPGKKIVYWKGQPVKEVEGFIYIILNKPEGYLSSRITEMDKKLGKKSMFDLIEKDKKLDEITKKTLFSVGRLDEDTSGLILITNDGKFCTKMTNPKHEIPKKYRVVLEKPLAKELIAKIEKGITIELEENGRITKYKTKACKINMMPGSDKELTLTLFEGKKREARRIFQAVGNKVIKLQRIAIGNLQLKEFGLKEGEFVFKDRKFIEERVFRKIFKPPFKN